MKTEKEILELRDRLVMVSLKNDYKFIYDHLLLCVREGLEKKMQEESEGALEDTVMDSIHTEHLDGHHSNTSASIGFEDAKEILDTYEANMQTIKQIYEGGK